MGSYLGLDIGTSSVKAVLIDERQFALASASLPLELLRPKEGWSEQNPQDWWRATQSAVATIGKRARKAFRAVEAIGLSGQMHGATLLDSSDRVIRPAILWNDGRADNECRELEAAEPRLREIAGNIAMPGFTAPKLLWVKKHEPMKFRRVAKVLLPKDYIRLRLSGDHASDMSDSSGTLWMDVGRRAWSSELLAATSLGEEHMPKLFEGIEATGQLSGELQREWGLLRRPIISGGAGDNAAAACGIGAVEAQESFVSLGTSGVLFVATKRFLPNTANAVHAFCHAIPDKWHQMGVILSATASLEWLAGIFGMPAPRLVKTLGSRVSGPSPVLFLPYLSGERTPVNDAHIRAVFCGLGHESDRKALIQAVVEGVAFAFRDCLESLRAAGTDVQRATAVGGGSNSRLWLKIIATVLGIPIDVPAAGDFGAAFGAARLALVTASGVNYRTILSRPKMSLHVDPDAASREAYEAAYASYKQIYPAVRGIRFHE
jgi:xylulokinase